MYIEEEQTTQWPSEKVQNDKQRSTKHTYKTKDRVTRTPLKLSIHMLVLISFALVHLELCSRSTISTHSFQFYFACRP